ncbi:MAG TPA: segregation/condensation protein A [Actinomycetota bacterium]|nr:segregation/condensation protein A [Actinomycetota bacterium]
MSFPVHLDVFEGPLDLLLQLVSRDRVDVGKVSIGTITDDYLRAVTGLGTLDLEAATSFLVLAATLLELKSAKLLPRDEADPEMAALLEERDRLLQRLVEYATFKAAAEALARVGDANAGYLSRAGGIPEEVQRVEPDPLAGVTFEDFLRAASAAFTPRPASTAGGVPVDVSYIAPIRVSLAEMIELLADELQRRHAASFRELCGSGATRIDVVVRFLALLELARQSFVEVEQTAPFEGITVRWRQPRTGPEPRAAGLGE